MRIRTKNFLFTSGIIIIVVTLAFGLLYWIMPGYYQQKKESELSKIMENVAKQIEGKTISEITEILDKTSLETGAVWTLINGEEQLIYPDSQLLNVTQSTRTSESAEIRDINGSVFGSGTAEPLITAVTIQTNDLGNWGDVIQKYKYFVDNESQIYKLNAIRTLQPIDEAKGVLLDIYPWILAVSFLIGGIGAFIYSYYSTKRIYQLSMITKQMTEMNETTRCPVVGKDEVSTLATDINYLYGNLLTTIEQLNQEIELTAEIERSKAEFMRIASHELKTPITAMSGIVEGMLYNVGEFKDRDHYLAICKEILATQSQLVKDILYISRLEMIEGASEREIFSVSELVEKEVLPVFELMAKTKKYKLETKIEPVQIEGVREDLKRVLMNLLSNALQYTSENGRIVVTLNEAGFALENECEPLTSDDLSKVFAAFYRPDYARARKDGGTGLGLYIVGQLLERDHLTYSFEPTKQKNGMIFKIKW
ncbi:sensor histidine kinase [Carnobacterium maltaromaticum]|uniref:sensor histidine kinase n=1 Tax=Carnobacterium maltaromaticum TaxID=2751 RepID=UPI0012F83553|nr:HAMP domain-containing sensor histidine kinase [Carnobacterium maltaromaticum]